MPEVTLILVVSLLIAAFIKPLGLNRIVSTAGSFIVLGAAGISIWGSGLRDLTPMYLWAGAWLWGMVIARVIRLFWMGTAQVTFKSPNQWPWLYWLLSAFWLAFAAGSIGYAFASNIAVSYAKKL